MVQQALETSYAQVQQFLESMAEVQRKDHEAQVAGVKADRMEPQARMMLDWLLAMHNKSAVAEEHLTIPVASIGELLEEADLAEFMEYSEADDETVLRGTGSAAGVTGNVGEQRDDESLLLSSEEDDGAFGGGVFPGSEGEPEGEGTTAWSRPSTYDYTDAAEELMEGNVIGGGDGRDLGKR